MAEHAAVFGGMILGQRSCLAGRIVTLLAEFFRFLLFHLIKALMVGVAGQAVSGFRWGVPEEGYHAGADHQKE